MPEIMPGEILDPGLLERPVKGVLHVEHRPTRVPRVAGMHE
jgi:hypothetical protein